LFAGVGKYYSGDNYLLAVVSTCLYAVSLSWVLSAPAILAERWFAPSERILALSIGYFCDVLGLSYGYLFAAY